MIGDRALETTTTVGTGTYALGGTSSGYERFVDGIGNGNGGFFFAKGDDGETDENEWEIFWGVVAAGSPDTLTRETIFRSTNSDNKVNWQAGTKTIYSIAPAALFSALAAWGHVSDGTRPAAITAMGRGVWTDGSATPAVVKWFDGTDDIKLFEIDESANTVALFALALTLSSTDAGATAGPTATLKRLSASPAANDLIGRLLFTGNNAASPAVEKSYADIVAQILDPADSAEDGALLLRTAVGGTLAARATLRERFDLAVAFNQAKAADVASAASPDIWTGTGNLVHITGTTTITGFAAAPQAGAMRMLVFDAALELTHGSDLVLNAGGANITTAAGDVAIVFADTTTKFYCYVIRASGKPLVPSDLQYTNSAETTSGTAVEIASSMPANLKRVTIHLEGVSTDTNNSVLCLQLGDSGGLDTSGYSGAGVAIAGMSAAVNTTGNTVGFNLTDSVAFDAGTAVTGKIVLDRVGANRWAVSGWLSGAGFLSFNCCGVKTLSAALDRLSLTTVAGTAAFDAGDVYVSAE
jgi:hypothetical protein